MKKEDYPWSGPWTSSGDPKFGFLTDRTSWDHLDCWKLSKKHQEIWKREVTRLRDFLLANGWELDVESYVRSSSTCDEAIAKVDFFVNGSCGAFSVVPGQTFVQARPEDMRWYGIRVYESDIPGHEDQAIGVRIFGSKKEREELREMWGDAARSPPKKRRSPGPCVEELFRLLPQNVTDMIEFFKRYK
jgi:hypothetical protein